MAKRGINEILNESRHAYGRGDKELGAALVREAFALPRKKTKPVSLAAKRRRSYFARMKW